MPDMSQLQQYLTPADQLPDSASSERIIGLRLSVDRYGYVRVLINQIYNFLQSLNSI